MRKGISPIIATVILIAVTLAIGIAVAAWLMGVWGGMGGTEALKILPTSELKVEEDGDFKELTLDVRNEGSKDTKIVEVQIDTGAGVCKTQNFEKVVMAGKRETGITVSLNCNAKFSPGASYNVKVITEAGNVYSTLLVARVE